MIKCLVENNIIIFEFLNFIGFSHFFALFWGFDWHEVFKHYIDSWEKEKMFMLIVISEKK